MVLEIKISNFYSINDEVTLDLRAGNIRSNKSKDLKDNVFDWGKETILKTVAIYGANAAGKSNIIKAIRFCCGLVYKSSAVNEDIVFDFKPFKFNKIEKPSTFFIRFVFNNIEYEYLFSLTTRQIITESLYHYPNKRKAKIFERDERIEGKKSKKYSFGSVIKRPLDVALNTSKRSLYISIAKILDRDIGIIIFDYFLSQFRLECHSIGPTSLFSIDTQLYLFKLFKGNEDLILKALQIADSDIFEIKMKEQKVPLEAFGIAEKGLLREAVKIKIETYHKKNPNITFDFETEESEGTKRMFEILLNLIDIIRSNKALIIDGLEDSLHPKIVEFIIELFHKSKGSQLIFSTHNTNLLDLNRMRKDQFYFVEKNEDAASVLYSLYDYPDFRENMDAEKGYLQGRFDAIPFVHSPDELIEKLIDE